MGLRPAENENIFKPVRFNRKWVNNISNTKITINTNLPLACHQFSHLLNMIFSISFLSPAMQIITSAI